MARSSRIGLRWTFFGHRERIARNSFCPKYFHTARKPDWPVCLGIDFLVLARIYRCWWNLLAFDSAVPLIAGFVLTRYEGYSNTCSLVPHAALDCRRRNSRSGDGEFRLLF